MERPLFLVLSPALQTYAWGKKGAQSAASSLKAGGDPDFVPDAEQTYAELWMGTHKKGPALITHPPSLSGKLLSDWLRDNTWALGERVSAEFSRELPFLFKVLSVNQALSIQAHPDKERAAELHSRAPDKYPDSNHKPEMVVALSEFEGLCGFRPFSDVRSWVMAVSELQQVLGDGVAESVASLGEDSSAEQQRTAMRRAFSALMSADPGLVKEEVTSLVERLGTCPADSLCREEKLLCQLNSLYPGDVGCFCVFFLNLVPLSPGGSLFLPANEPHCYLRGDVIECMACSDNVVRAGLTQKFKDKETLCDMLTYQSKTPDHFQVEPQLDKRSQFCKVYDPPVPEFAVAKVCVPLEITEFKLPSLEGPSILLVLEGGAKIEVDLESYNIRRGTVLFISAGTELKFLEKKQELVMFRAYCVL